MDRVQRQSNVSVHLQLIATVLFLLLPIPSIGGTDNMIDVVVNDVPFKLRAFSEDQVRDFCRLQRMTEADCEKLTQFWIESHREESFNSVYHCPTSLYIIPMGKKVHNFAPRFNLQKNGTYLHANPDDPDWLLSILSTKSFYSLLHNVTIHVVPPWRENPESPPTAAPWTPPIDSNENSCRNILALLVVSLHEFGKGVEVRRAQLVIEERDRIMGMFQKSYMKGVGRVGVVISDDEFFSFPLSFYDSLDLVFRLGDWDPRVCTRESKSCGHVHWIPRGPSSAFQASSKRMFQKSHDSKKDASTFKHIRASKRKWIANFIGNVDASICIGETTFEKTDHSWDDFLPRLPVKSCYRPSPRAAAFSAMERMQGDFDLLLRPTSGFGLNSKHGKPISAGLAPEEYAIALRNSVFTVCPPSTSPESTRIYEALEAGSIPILTHISAETGLPFGPECPLPYVAEKRPLGSFHSGSDWETRLPLLIKLYVDSGTRALDKLQEEVQEWWATFKKKKGKDVAKALLHLLNTPKPVACNSATFQNVPLESPRAFKLNKQIPDHLLPRYHAIWKHIKKIDDVTQQSIANCNNTCINPDREINQLILSSLNEEQYVVGWAIENGRRLIHDLWTEAESRSVVRRWQPHSLHLQFGMFNTLNTKSQIFFLGEALRIALRLRLWDEFDCMSVVISWYDPYSIAWSHLKEESFRIREDWLAHSHQHNITRALVNMSNISKANGRFPLLPDSIAEIWSGGLRTQLLFSSLRMCLSNGRHASRMIYGDLADDPITESLQDSNKLDAHLREWYYPIMQ